MRPLKAAPSPRSNDFLAGLGCAHGMRAGPGHGGRLRADPLDDVLHVLAWLPLAQDEPMRVVALVGDPWRSERDQPAFRKVRAQELQPPERDALACERSVDHLVVLVEADDALGTRLVPAAGGEPAGPLEMAAARVVELEQEVLRELVGPLERRKAERGARDRGERLAEKPLRPRGRRGGRTVADREIDALAAQVDEPRVGRDAQVDVGVARLEVAHARKQPQAGEADGRRDGDGPSAARDADVAHHLLELAHRSLGDLEESLTLWRERKGAMAAHEKLHAEHVLERVDLAADRRLREEEILAGER